MAHGRIAFSSGVLAFGKTGIPQCIWMAKLRALQNFKILVCENFFELPRKCCQRNVCFYTEVARVWWPVPFDISLCTLPVARDI